MVSRQFCIGDSCLIESFERPFPEPETASNRAFNMSQNSKTIFAKTLFLYACRNASEERRAKEYPSYLLHECGIVDPVAFFHDLHNDGLFQIATPEQMLNSLPLAKLKSLLRSHGCSTTGTKSALVLTALSKLSENEIRGCFSGPVFGLSNLGIRFLADHDDYIMLHSHSWNIEWGQYDSRKRSMPNQPRSDVVASILNERIGSKNNPFGWVEHFGMYEAFMMDNRHPEAFWQLLVLFYLELSGCLRLDSVILYNEGLISANDLVGEYVDQATSSNTAEYIHELSSCFRPELEKNITNWELPVFFCGKDGFHILLDRALQGRFYQKSVESILKRSMKTTLGWSKQ